MGKLALVKVYLQISDFHVHFYNGRWKWVKLLIGVAVKSYLRAFAKRNADVLCQKSAHTQLH